MTAADHANAVRRALEEQVFGNVHTRIADVAERMAAIERAEV